jgi:hypothetical protein
LVAVHFSSKSTISLPRLVAVLIAIVCVAGAISFAAAGQLQVTVLLPATVVFGMGLYFGAIRRYDVMDDKIRLVGVLGQRELYFDKIHGFEDAQPESFTARWQSFMTGAPLASAIEVDAERSFFSNQAPLWVENREEFIAAAREALARWRAARASGARTPSS